MAEFEKRLACVIRADGTIARGYMIDKCQFFRRRQSIYDHLANTLARRRKDQFRGNHWQCFRRTSHARADYRRPWSRSGRDAGPYL